MNWSDERPTEPGEYWVSIAPKKRQGINRTYPVKTTIRRHEQSGLLLASFSGLGDEICWGFLDDAPVYDGAKWARREVPADPFQP